MPYIDLELAASRCRRTREFVILNPGGREDPRTRQRLYDLLSGLRDVVDDDECERLVRAIEGCALDLFSENGHLAWRHGEASGADVLRLQILRWLDAYRDRLSAIEASRPSVERVGCTGLMRA